MCGDDPPMFVLNMGDIANHVLLAVGVLNGCRILHLDLVRLLEH
jgi:hypothetical protein